MKVIPAVGEPAGVKPGEYPWAGAIGIFSYLAPTGKLPGIKKTSLPTEGSQVGAIGGSGLDRSRQLVS
jgi:hypothetical protein